MSFFRVAFFAANLLASAVKTVFPLETKSDAEDDDDDDGDGGGGGGGGGDDGGTIQSTPKNFRRHRRSRPEDSVSASAYVPGSDEALASLQLAAADTFAADESRQHFRFADNSPFPVTSGHAHCDAACCREATARSEDSGEANFSVEQSEVTGSQLSTSSQTNYSVAPTSDPAAAAADAAASVPSSLSRSSSSSSSAFFTLFSLMSRLHRRHVMRSLGHVLNPRWIRRSRVPAAAAGDQSTPSDATRDHVDMTSLLPAV